jgi:hypothetical protein
MLTLTFPECTGPVVVRVRKAAIASAVSYGPFDLVRAFDGLLSSGGASGLSICLPAWTSHAAEPCHEVMLLPA